MATFVNQLVEKEVLTPDKELERHLRQLAKLPEYHEPEPEYDDNGNVIASRKQDISIEKAALLLRRVGLAVNSIRDSGTPIDQTRIDSLIIPLWNELEDGVANELGGMIPNQKPLGDQTDMVDNQDKNIDPDLVGEDQGDM